MTDLRSTSSLSCEQASPLLEALVADDLDGRSATALLHHARSCESCSDLFDLHVALTEQSGLAPAASDDDFAEVRSEVLSQLKHLQLGNPGFAEDNPGSAEEMQNHTRAHAHKRLLKPWAVGALAAAALVLAFGTGWRAANLSSPSTDLGALWVSELGASNTSFDTSPYEFQDVRVRPVNQSTVALSFDVATHVELERPHDDPLVQEALIRSIRGGSDLGGRLQAIQQTAASPAESQDLRVTRFSGRVRDALITAMLSDPSLAVRMEAQNRLAQGPPDPAVEKALVQVLDSEESVQQRLLAIDALGNWGMSANSLRDAFSDGRGDPGAALEVRAARFPNDV